MTTYTLSVSLSPLSVVFCANFTFIIKAKMDYFILALIINVNFAQKMTLCGLSDTLSVYADRKRQNEMIRTKKIATKDEQAFKNPLAENINN